MQAPISLIQSELTRVASIAHALANEITTLHCNQQNATLTMEQCKECVYVRTLLGEISFWNSRYNKLFGVTRERATKYFQITDWITNQREGMLDQAMRDGMQCSQAAYNYDHENGSSISVVVCKVLLAECRDPRFGWVNVLQILDSHKSIEQPLVRVKVRQAWKRFQTLSDSEKIVAVSLAIGEPLRRIADQIGTCARTVENYKIHILKTIGVDNTNQLGVVLCRIQDAGLADLRL